MHATWGLVVEAFYYLVSDWPTPVSVIPPAVKRWRSGGKKNICKNTEQLEKVSTGTRHVFKNGPKKIKTGARGITVALSDLFNDDMRISHFSSVFNVPWI